MAFVQLTTVAVDAETSNYIYIYNICMLACIVCIILCIIYIVFKARHVGHSWSSIYTINDHANIILLLYVCSGKLHEVVVMRAGVEHLKGCYKIAACTSLYMYIRDTIPTYLLLSCY